MDGELILGDQENPKKTESIPLVSYKIYATTANEFGAGMDIFTIKCIDLGENLKKLALDMMERGLVQDGSWRRLILDRKRTKVTKFFIDKWFD